VALDSRAMSDASDDPIVKQYRSQISDTDLVIVQAVNKRVSLVSRLHAYKRLSELYHFLLDLSKAEAKRLAEREAKAS
jgi:hypothetical protein